MYFYIFLILLNVNLIFCGNKMKFCCCSVKGNLNNDYFPEDEIEIECFENNMKNMKVKYVKLDKGCICYDDSKFFVSLNSDARFFSNFISLINEKGDKFDVATIDKSNINIKDYFKYIDSTLHYVELCRGNKILCKYLVSSTVAFHDKTVYKPIPLVKIESDFFYFKEYHFVPSNQLLSLYRIYNDFASTIKASRIEDEDFIANRNILKSKYKEEVLRALLYFPSVLKVFLRVKEKLSKKYEANIENVLKLLQNNYTNLYRFPKTYFTELGEILNDKAIVDLFICEYKNDDLFRLGPNIFLRVFDNIK